MLEPISKPKIYTGGRGGKKSLKRDWYVRYSVVSPVTGKKETRQIKGGINRYHTIAERWEAACILRDALYKRLLDGWNPLHDHAEQISLPQALKIGLDRRKVHLSKNSLNDFMVWHRRLEAVVPDVPLVGLRKRDCILLLDAICEQWDLTDKAYNKGLFHIKALFSEFVELELIDKNPFFGIKSRKTKKDPIRTATPKEKEKLKKHLVNICPPYWTFVQMTYHLGARPNETRNLLVGDFDGEYIQIWANIAKRDGRRFPVPDVFVQELQAHVLGAKKDWYMFGKGFVPGPEKMREEESTSFWKTHVKDGLGFKFNQYSMKHLGADDKIRAGMPLEALRLIYGHRSSQMTETYAQAIFEQYYKKIKGAPDF